MRHLTLKNLSLVSKTCSPSAWPPCRASRRATSFVPFLTTRRNRITALPAELTGLPQAEALAFTDRRHDGFGGAIYYFARGSFRLPDATPAMFEATTKIRAAFIPSLDLLQARYDVEAQAAVLNAPLVESLEAELMMFPVAPNATLHDVALAFVDEGKELGALLSQRADAKDRKLAVQLRGETLAKLNRLREESGRRAEGQSKPRRPRSSGVRLSGSARRQGRCRRRRAEEEGGGEGRREEEGAGEGQACSYPGSCHRRHRGSDPGSDAHPCSGPCACSCPGSRSGRRRHPGLPDAHPRARRGHGRLSTRGSASFPFPFPILCLSSTRPRLQGPCLTPSDPRSR